MLLRERRANERRGTLFRDDPVADRVPQVLKVYTSACTSDAGTEDVSKVCSRDVVKTV